MMTAIVLATYIPTVWFLQRQGCWNPQTGVKTALVSNSDLTRQISMRSSPQKQVPRDLAATGPIYVTLTPKLLEVSFPKTPYFSLNVLVRTGSECFTATFSN